MMSSLKSDSRVLWGILCQVRAADNCLNRKSNTPPPWGQNTRSTPRTLVQDAAHLRPINGPIPSVESTLGTEGMYRDSLCFQSHTSLWAGITNLASSSTSCADSLEVATNTELSPLPRYIAMTLFVKSVAPRRLRATPTKICAHRHFPTLAAAEKRPNLPHISICTGPSCRGKSLVTTLRAITPESEPYIAPSGCLGECGKGPNVAVETDESMGAYIQTHVNCLNAAVKLLKQLQFQVDEQILVAAREKEQGDNLLRADRESEAVYHYEKALDLINNCGESTKTRAQDFSLAIICNWAQSLVNTSAYREALSLLNDALDVQPQCVSAWKWKARAHEGLRDFNMANSSWEMWGKLSGKSEEAKKQIRRFTGWRAFLVR